MAGVRIRAATPGEAESVLDMMEDFNALEAIPWRRETASQALKILLASPTLGVCGEILEGDLGCGYFVLTWGFDLEWSGRDAFLTELYLLPAARGRGLGRAALALIERLAAERGARALHLLVRPENAAALRLYRSAGFASPPRAFLSKELPPAT